MRCFVLFVLRLGEAIAADFVFEVTGAPPDALDGFAAAGDGARDATWLAARFRALAAALYALLGRDGVSARRGASIAGALRRFEARLGVIFVVLGGLAPELVDTS